MNNSKPIERYLILFLPWVISLIFDWDPAFSYVVAWCGSFFIFYISFTGWIKPIPADRPIAEQLMRPIFLIQIIFAGYMACTSIFYFFNVLGYDGLHKIGNSFFAVDRQKLKLTAVCQRYYLLGHASFVAGIIVCMNYPVKQKYYIEKENLANILLVTAIIALPVSIICSKIPGLSQFYFQYSSLSFISGTLALAFAIPLKKMWNTVICLFLYISNFYQALTSGFKEPIIISVLVLGIFLYPNYKKLVTIIFVPLVLMLFALLPTYNRIFRQNAWVDGDVVNADAAYKAAFNGVINPNPLDDEGNWDFLCYRLSEIDMFTTYVQSTPKTIPYYGVKLLKQSAIAIIPRAFWPSKPSTEELIMERVYNAGVIERGSSASAKPPFIVDAYLSGGTLGIFLSLFLYGAIAQLISHKAEHLFGGYVLGTALIFSGLFQIFWRGLSFEFLINSVFWSYITMFVVFKILRNTGILKVI